MNAENENAYIEIRLHLKSGKITVTDENHNEIKQGKKDDPFGKSRDQPEELLKKLWAKNILILKLLLTINHLSIKK